MAREDELARHRAILIATRRRQEEEEQQQRRQQQQQQQEREQQEREQQMQMRLQQQEQQEQQQQADFEMFDKNGDGTVSQEELGAVLTRATVQRPAFSKQDAESTFAKVDTNGDGHVDKEEFVAAWQQPQPQQGVCARKRCPDQYKMEDRGDRCMCKLEEEPEEEPELDSSNATPLMLLDQYFKKIYGEGVPELEDRERESQRGLADESLYGLAQAKLG